MRYDPDRHHRRSIRLPGYDYGAAGSYFVTICAHDRALLFGDVINGDVVLNGYGRIVAEEWYRSAEMRREMELDAMVVMPNHLHGIVTLIHVDDFEQGDPRGGSAVDDEGARHPPLRQRPRSLGSFVAGFKAAATRRINDVRGTSEPPVWQRNYYEHVIRDDDGYARIYNYIMTNPLRWELDRENLARWGDDEFDNWLGSFGAT